MKHKRNHGQKVDTHTKDLILTRDYYICQYCGYSSRCFDDVRGLTVDHIIPVCFEGLSTYDNLICCCSVCNKYAHSACFDTFQEKKKYVLDLLKRKKITIYWSDYVLKEYKIIWYKVS